jgi:uncharacterized cupin superfamily protein
MAGQVQVRIPSGTETVNAGEGMCFPSGADGAHKVWNASEQPARIVMFSGTQEPSVAVYPDSDKVGVWTGDDRDKWMFRGAVSHLEYFDGEPMDAF